jgi:hypothetical protein
MRGKVKSHRRRPQGVLRYFLPDSSGTAFDRQDLALKAFSPGMGSLVTTASVQEISTCRTQARDNHPQECGHASRSEIGRCPDGATFSLRRDPNGADLAWKLDEALYPQGQDRARYQLDWRSLANLLFLPIKTLPNPGSDDKVRYPGSE